VEQLGAIGLAAALAFSLLNACQEMPDVVQVTIRNDASQAVTLQQCDVRCNQVHRTETLEPGATVKVNTSTGDVPNYWMVIANEKVTGCLNLLENGYHPGDVFNVTHTVRCPT
jgi:hypothetical protein